MKRIVKILIATTVIISCNRNDDFSITPKGDFEYGFLVMNEGNFAQNNGSLNFVSSDFVRNDKNVFPNLGDTPQSGLRDGDHLYLIINGSNKIIKVNRYTLQKEAELTTDLKNPRYMTIANGQGYVTNWGEGSNSTDDYVLVIDLNTLQPIKKISVEEGPEKIFTFNNKVYALLQGGWGSNNKIAVIETNNNTVEEYKTTGANPNGYLIEGNQVLITCGGEYNYPNQVTDGSIWTLTSSGLDKTYDWATTTSKKEGIKEIVRVGNSYFFLVDSQLHKASVGSDLTQSTLVDNTPFYRLSSLGNRFAVGLNAKDYISDGEAVFFNESGKQKTVSTGINPNSIIE